MRDIKFRVWDKVLSEMFPVMELQWVDGAIIGHRIGSEDGSIGTFNAGLKDIELMQFTGLKDKDGGEIYEGDIVRIFVENEFGSREQHVGQVKWKQEWGGFEIDITTTRGDSFEIDAPEDEPLELLGNIYQDPDLLYTSPRSNHTVK